MKTINRNILTGIYLLLLGLCLQPTIRAEPAFGKNDWPHWRGQHWDGFSLEKDLSPKKLSKEAVMWETKIGHGYSSMAVVGGLVYTVGRIEATEYMYCLNASKIFTVPMIFVSNVSNRCLYDNLTIG